MDPRPRRPPTHGSPAIDPEILRFLDSPAGRSGLVAAKGVRSLPLHKRLDALPEALGRPERRALLHQDDLRVAAERKCPTELTEQLLWLESALEQATAWWVARYRARKWPAEAVVYDLGAGQGLDTLAALIAGRQVVAYEHDPLRAALLAVNARALGVDERLTVEAGDLGRAANAEASAFLDPDRRPEGERERDPEAYSPPLSSWPEIAERFARVLIKAPPVLDEPMLATVHFEIVSLDGRIRERLLRVGDWPADAPRRATALTTRADEVRTIAGEGRAWPEPRLPEAGQWLIDPDASVTVAGLVGELAAATKSMPVHERIAWLLADEAPAAVPASLYLIDEVVGARPKHVRRWLRENNIARYEVKTRGVDDDAATWRKRIGAPPHRKGNGAVLCFTRDLKDRWCCLAAKSE